MNKYIQKIANINIKSILKEENDKKFKKDFDALTSEIYEEEVAKIIYDFCNYTYSRKECIRYYIVNDILLYQPEDYLLYLKKIWEYSLENEILDDLHILSYFINSLYFSYSNGEKYKNHNKNDEYVKIFTKKYFPKRDFFKGGNIYQNCLQFAYDIMSFGFADYDNIHKLDGLLYDSVRIASQDDKKTFSRLLNKLVALKSYYNEYLIEYDKNIKDNYQNYLDYEVENANQDFHNDYSVLNKLYERCDVSKEDEERIIKVLEKRIDLISTDENPIRNIAQYESVINEIIRLRSIRNFHNKEELKRIQKKASSLKMKTTKSFDKNSLQTFEQKMEIPQKLIEQMESNLKSNIISGLFSNCMVNFENMIEESIQTALLSPLTFLAKSISITNREEGIYETEDLKSANGCLKEYYTKLIEKKFKENESSYENAHIFESKNAYANYMNYMKEIVSMQTSLCAALFKNIYKNDSEMTILNAINNDANELNYKNYYMMLMPLLLGIEVFILRLYNYYQHNRKKEFKNEYLDIVFKNIIIKDNNFTNSIMYLNFILYDNNGFRIRNRIAHGNYKCDLNDLSIFIQVVVAWACASDACANILGNEDD